MGNDALAMSSCYNPQKHVNIKKFSVVSNSPIAFEPSDMIFSSDVCVFLCVYIDQIVFVYIKIPLSCVCADTECKLRRWDMDMKFGPCIGMPRMRRWERAEKLGLTPPTEIRNLLLTSNASEDCLWQHRV